MYGLLQKCKIQLVATGLFEGPAIFVVLLVIVLVLILVLVGIIAAEIVSKVKKTDSPSDSRNSGDSVDDEWVKDVVREITSYEGQKAEEDFEGHDRPEMTDSESEGTENTILTDGHALISLRHVTAEADRKSGRAGIAGKLLDRITEKNMTGKIPVVLDDVSFDVSRGETVGIIGTDGAGKKALIRLINGEVEPSGGNIIVNTGDIHILTPDFPANREITGRKYLYKCAKEEGYTKVYADLNYDRIVEFAELGGFMDEKIKNYSAGMLARLKFAVTAADDNPGILILDEFLSTCDIFCRKKCENSIRRMAQGGTAVIIVSNVMNLVAKNCTGALWIENGTLRMTGEPQKVCSAFIHMQS